MAPAAELSASGEVPAEPIELLPEYRRVLQAVRGGCLAQFVTGRAGTGKSTLIRWLREQLESTAVVAPTAVAATHVQGETIHSLFGLPPRLIDPGEPPPTARRVREVLAHLDCLIIDEASMLLPNLVDVMHAVLVRARRSAEPFGGLPVVFVGDLLQLPPVVASAEEAAYFSERYATPYFFSADVFQRAPLLPTVLERVRRQADAVFIEALSRIRLNEDCAEAIALFNRRCLLATAPTAPAGVRLVPTNRAARAVNAAELRRLPGAAVGYVAEASGELPASRWRLPVPEHLELKPGARVIFLKNHRPDWMNGELGEALALEPDCARVCTERDKREVGVRAAVWQRYRYAYDRVSGRVRAEVVGEFRQLPLALGWAVTIHKAQGLTLEHLTLDLRGGAFAQGQTYVALSRARSLDGIRLVRPIRAADLRVDPRVIAFYRERGLDR